MNPANQRSSECRPYGCNMAEGVCYTQCNLKEHCARNYVCDVPHCRHHSEFLGGRHGGSPRATRAPDP